MTKCPPRPVQTNACSFAHFFCICYICVLFVIIFICVPHRIFVIIPSSPSSSNDCWLSCLHISYCWSSWLFVMLDFLRATIYEKIYIFKNKYIYSISIAWESRLLSGRNGCTNRWRQSYSRWPFQGKYFCSLYFFLNLYSLFCYLIFVYNILIFFANNILYFYKFFFYL